MPTPRRLRCPACDAGWDPAAARFCGRCGAALAPAGADAPARPSERPRLRGAYAVGGGVTALVLGAAVWLMVPTLPPSGPDGNDEVALPDTVSDPGTAGDDAATADPDVGPPAAEPAGPLRCEPAGCERWRRPLPAPGSRLAAGGDVVVALAGAVLHAVDAEDGTTRWTARLAGPARDGTYTVAFDAPIGMAVDDDLVVVSGGPGWVQARDVDDGSLRWSHNVGYRVRSIELGREVVVTTRAERRRPRGRTVAVLDRRDGHERWSGWVERLLAVDDDRLLVRAGAVTRVLDAATGEIRFETNGRAEPVGPWLAMADVSATRLLDPEDGRELGVHRGHLQAGPVDVGGVWLVVLAPPVRPWASEFEPRLLALERDGTLRWERELRVTAEDCCVVVRWGDGDTVLVEATGPERALLLDARTGEVERSLEPSPLGDPGDVTRAGLWVAEGEGRLTLVEPPDAVRVDGQPVLVHDRPPVVADRGELLGLRLDARSSPDGRG